MTNIVVDLVEECLSTNAEILQVAKTIMAGAIAAVRSVVAILLPWAVGVWLEAWWLVWFRCVVVATVRSWLWWTWLVWSRLRRCWWLWFVRCWFWFVWSRLWCCWWLVWGFCWRFRLVAI